MSSNILYSIDQPATMTSRRNDVVTFSGWAISKDGKPVTISVLINNLPGRKLVPDQPRPDVREHFEGRYEVPHESGFSFRVPTGDYDPGQPILVCVEVGDGAEKIRSAVYTVEAACERCVELEERLRRHDLLPEPPPNLRRRVGADEGVDKFLGIGRTLLGDLKILTAQVGYDFDSFRSILDFGCGCGRVIRYISPGGRALFGTDIDPESVAWCAENLGGVARFAVNRPEPPLEYAADSFDLVYAISVFTHLPEEMGDAWLKELHRVVRPGGLLLASVLGEGNLPAAPSLKEARKAVRKSGFYYTAGVKTAGLPEFYGLAWHSPEYIRKRWSRLFNPLAFIPRALNNHQDGVVLRKE